MAAIIAVSQHWPVAYQPDSEAPPICIFLDHTRPQFAGELASVDLSTWPARSSDHQVQLLLSLLRQPRRTDQTHATDHNRQQHGDHQKPRRLRYATVLWSMFWLAALVLLLRYGGEANSRQTARDHTAPKTVQAAPEANGNSDRAALSDAMTADGTISNGTSSDGTGSDGTGSEGALSDDAISDGAIFDGKRLNISEQQVLPLARPLLPNSIPCITTYNQRHAQGHDPRDLGRWQRAQLSGSFETWLGTPQHCRRQG